MGFSLWEKENAELGTFEEVLVYWVDGERLGYDAMLAKVVEALEDCIEVSYAYHRAADCYWIDEEHPWYSKPVYLDDDGIKANGQIIEHLQLD